MQYAPKSPGYNTLFIAESADKFRPAKRAEILSVARELVSTRSLRGDLLNNSERVKTFLKMRLSALEHEVFSLLLLDNQMQLITYLEPFRGSISEAAVYPREVVKLALHYNAAVCILAHNHPAGCATPSGADINLTKRLSEALSLVDIRVVDHILIADSDAVSFAQRGLI